MLIFFGVCICIKVLISIDKENNRTLNLDTGLTFVKTDLKNRKLFWNLDYDNNKFRLRTGRRYLKITGDNILDFSDGGDEMEDYDENEKINELREVIRQDEDKGRGNGSRNFNNSRNQNGSRGSNYSRNQNGSRNTSGSNNSRGSSYSRNSNDSRSRGNNGGYDRSSAPTPQRGPFGNRNTTNQDSEAYNDPIVPKNRGRLISLSSELVGDTDNEVNSGLFELQSAFNMNSNSASGLKEDDDDTEIAKKLENNDVKPIIETAKPKLSTKKNSKVQPQVSGDSKKFDQTQESGTAKGEETTDHSNLESKLTDEKLESKLTDEKLESKLTENTPKTSESRLTGDAVKQTNKESHLAATDKSFKSNIFSANSQKSFATRQNQPKPSKGFIFKLIPTFNNKLEKKMLILVGSLCLTHDLEFRNCDFKDFWDLERDFYWDIYRADDLSIMDKVLKTLKSKSRNNDKIKSAAYADINRCPSTCPEGNCNSEENDEGFSTDQSTNNTQYNLQNTNPPISNTGNNSIQRPTTSPIHNIRRNFPSQAPNRVNTNVGRQTNQMQGNNMQRGANFTGNNNKLVTITEDLFRELSRAYKEGR